MKLGRVIANVSASRKDPTIEGKTMLVVRYLDAELRETSTVAACVDTVGAGTGDVVMLCSSSSARLTSVTSGTCTDNAIIGIVETVASSKHELYARNANKKSTKGGRA
ncbi:MAG TPA: EutN/CcmL family microcompartment protein [Bacteroidota bacterium]|nr:EutN/CcmL family microcompartment protein [Bacteroidota bacterium]